MLLRFFNRLLEKGLSPFGGAGILIRLLEFLLQLHNPLCSVLRIGVGPLLEGPLLRLRLRNRSLESVRSFLCSLRRRRRLLELVLQLRHPLRGLHIIGKRLLRAPFFSLHVCDRLLGRVPSRCAVRARDAAARHVDAREVVARVAAARHVDAREVVARVAVARDVGARVDGARDVGARDAGIRDVGARRLRGRGSRWGGLGLPRRVPLRGRVDGRPLRLQRLLL
mmetsp:Transcript_14368/g.39423  ORF Transcript_14368/g.39423 Transcript_14368/m.39423 type:complete len:224 (-) Transcript_14368:188-859(-)